MYATLTYLKLLSQWVSQYYDNNRTHDLTGKYTVLSHVHNTTFLVNFMIY